MNHYFMFDSALASKWRLLCEYREATVAEWLARFAAACFVAAFLAGVLS